MLEIDSKIKRYCNLGYEYKFLLYPAILKSYRTLFYEPENRKSKHHISTNYCFPYSQEDII